jgi:hypothetical protein
MAGELARRMVRLGPGGAPSVTYTLPQSAAFRVEAVSFTLDNTGGAGPANPVVIYRDQAGNTIFAQILAAAQNTGTSMIYTASPFADPCGTGQTTLGNLTPDTIASIALEEGCSIQVQAANSTTGANVAGALITSPFAWVEDIGGSALEDAIPQLTPLAMDEQAA